MSGDWLAELKAAYEAGYYQTEAAVEQQSSFPWQNKLCRDCPFWMEGDWCQVHLAHCSPDEPPCAYFHPPDHSMASCVIEDRLRIA
jgi:hypothetical protein